MSDSQRKNYVIYIDNTEAEKNVQRLEKTAARLEKEIEKITSSGGDATKQMQKLAQTQADIKKMESSVKDGSKSLRDMAAEVKRLENALQRIPVSNKKAIEEMQAQLTASKANLEQYRGTVLNVGKANNQMASETRGFFGSMKDFVVGTFLGGGLVGIAQTVLTTVTGFFTDSREAAAEADKAVRMFNNTMDNLGKGADAGRFSDFASRLKGELNFLDDEDILGVLEKLQTYGKLTEQQIRQLTPVIIDFATKHGKSLSEAAGEIIKALEGSAKELKAYGLNLKEAGTVSERFDVIMTDLKGKVDGAAKTFQESAEGPVAEYRQEIADLQEEIGERLTPAFLTLTKIKASVIGFFADLYDMVDKGYILFRRQTESAIELQNTLSKFQKDNDFTQSLVQDFSGVSLDEQKKRVESNKALMDGSRALVEQLEKEKNTRSEIYRNAVAQLAQDKILFEETDRIYNNNIRERDQRKAEEDAEKREKEAEKKREKALQKQERDYERLKDFLTKTTQEITSFNMAEYQKEIQAVYNKYAEFERLAKKGSAEEIALARNKAAEIDQVNRKYAAEAQKGYEEAMKQRALLQKAEIEKEKKERENILKSARDSARAFSGQLERNVRSLDTAKLITADLKVRKSGLIDRLKAEKEYFNESQRQEENALAASLASGEMSYAEFLARKEDMGFRYRESEYNAEITFYQNLIDAISNYANIALSLFDSIAQQQAARNQEELARDKELNEEKRKHLKAQLDGRLISRAQYDQKISELDKNVEAKERAYRKREFNSFKISNITRAIISTAQAVVQALTAGPFIGPVLAGVVGAMGAAQVAVIASQKAPEYGKGGKLNGPSHDSKYNGMPVTNPETGQVQAYVQGGEGILKKEAMEAADVYTISGTPSAITSKLNRMYGGVSWDASATLMPSFSRYRPMEMDYPSITRTIGNVRQYETGGVLLANNATESPRPTVNVIDPALLNTVNETAAAVKALTAVLSNGIYAKTYLNEAEANQARLNNLREDSTFRA